MSELREHVDWGDDALEVEGPEDEELEVALIAQTEKAYLVLLDGEERWVPKAHSWYTKHEDGREVLHVQHWLFMKLKEQEDEDHAVGR